MDLAQRIQAKTDNGDTIIDFLVEVMKSELDDFRLCHRLQAARLLANYGCCHKPAGAARSPLTDEAINFIVDNPSEPSLRDSGPGSSHDTLFDSKLAMVIRDATDDGASICRFLINVMEGELKAFTPQNRLSAARELLSRGFGKHTSTGRSGEEPAPYAIRGRNQEERSTGGPHLSTPNPQPTESDKSPNLINPSSDSGETPTTQPTKSEKSPNHTNPSSDEEINKIIDAAKERSDRILAEQGLDPDNPPHKPDYSAFDLAADNSHRWFHEWKNSIDPEEYQAVIKKTSERFDTRIDRRIERRKQIKVERERREKEDAERQSAVAEQARARAEAKAKAEAEAKEEEELGPPPTKEEHELVSATPSIPGSFVLRNCQHPKCKLHDGPRYFPEDDRGSPYYNPGNAPSLPRTFNPRL